MSSLTTETQMTEVDESYMRGAGTNLRPQTEQIQAELNRMNVLDEQRARRGLFILLTLYPYNIVYYFIIFN